MRPNYDLRYEQVMEAYNHQWAATVLQENLQRIAGDQSVGEIEKFLEGQSKDLKILDVGCGMGRLLDYLRAKGHDITGIDITKSGPKIYKAHCPAARLVCGSAAELPFRKNSFDLVMLMGVVYEIPDPGAIQAMLRKMVELICGDGRLIYACQYPKDLWKTVLAHIPIEKRWFRQLFMPTKVDHEPHFARWVISNRETVDLFEQSGWRLERIEPLNHYYGAANMFFDLFYKNKNTGVPLPFAADDRPRDHVRMPGRLIASFSRRFAPMLCPGLVFFQFAKADVR